MNREQNILFQSADRGVRYVVTLFAVATLLALSACAFGGPASAQSVDPETWVKADLLIEVDGGYVYDHVSECAMRDEAAKPTERAVARVRAKAPHNAMSRDQLIALVQRMESVFFMSIGQGFRPSATAMMMASIIDCRPRPNSTQDAHHELILEITETGFVSTFVNHATDAKSTHAETWVEAFRP
jgi:hypothetical protein